MQLNRGDIVVFADREKRQGRILKGALQRHHQKIYRRPADQLKRLRATRRLELGATNPYARITWIRTLGAQVLHHLGAASPSFTPNQPVFLVTILDQTMVVDEGISDDRWGVPWDAIFLAEVRRTYQNHLNRLNYVGMIDAALYVSARKVFGVSRRCHLHAHALVWGISAQRIQRCLEGSRRTIKSLLGHVTSVDIKQVRKSDLRQVLWYVLKAPCKQYQVQTRQTGRSRQWKRQINGVNSVRLHRMIGKVTLDVLTIAGGEGLPLRTAAFAEIQRRRRRQNAH